MTKNEFRNAVCDMIDDLSDTVGATEPLSAQIRPFDAALADFVKGIETAQTKTWDYLVSRGETNHK